MTIYHIFDARQMHHALHMIKDLNETPYASEMEYILLKYRWSLSEEAELSRVTSNRTQWLTRRQMAMKMIRESFTAKTTFVLHGFSLWIFFLNLGLPLRKSRFYWICWGSGLQDHHGIKGILYRTVKFRLYNSLDKINVLMSPDKDALIALGVKTEIQVIPYRFNLRDGGKRERKADDHINVLVGNSAGGQNNHLEVLDSLSKVNNCTCIYIHLFLNYSIKSSDYIRDIKTSAESKFPGRTRIYEELMSREAYDEIIKKIDVLIIDSEFQTGLAAIYNVICNNGTIYLRDNGRNKRWMDHLQILTYPTGILENATTLNLISPQQATRNRERLNEKLSKDSLTLHWGRFLDLCNSL